MPTPGTGWAKLGDVLGGDSELEYEKGLNLGANTENALSQASERRAKAKAQQGLAGQLRAAGFADADADAASSALTAGGNLGDIFGARQTQQKIDFHAKAGDPTLPFDQRQIAAEGLVDAPVERFAGAGPGMLQDKFSNDQPTLTPIGQSDINKNNATASRAGGKSKVYMVGGVPYMVGADGELQRKLTPEEVAENVGIISNEKSRGANAAKAEAGLPKSFAKFRNTTENADKVMGDIDNVLKDVKWTNAGPSAWLSRGTPGTPAFALDHAVMSLKANVGFQTLNSMRNESPTGGALGNVTDQDIKYLQSSIASLDTAQDPAQLAKALTAVRDNYARLKEHAAQDFEITSKLADYHARSSNNPSEANPHPLAAPTQGGQPRAFATEAEAEAAGLSDGTKITVGGRPATWYN